jgi:hypothetical protein
VGKKLLALLWLILSMPAGLPGLHVKVISVDHKEGRIQVLLPMHHVIFEASLAAQEPEIRVRVNEFYEAELVTGEVDTAKRNYLLIKIPDQKPARFRLQKVSFLE